MAAATMSIYSGVPTESAAGVEKALDTSPLSSEHSVEPLATAICASRLKSSLKSPRPTPSPGRPGICSGFYHIYTLTLHYEGVRIARHGQCQQGRENQGLVQSRR